ncbi:MAG: 50S ribosomal protein L13 [Vampirovibrionales bacterium]|nr:50S ribosomal protein L13 [Vampirovibrionales bacterium]
MKTYSAKPLEVERDWWIIDAQDLTLGRLATEIANLLRGKHKPQYTPHLDTGDFVIVINADKIRVTGKKFNQKKYYTHSLYPGGLTTRTFRQLQETHPTRIIERAVWGMVPHNTLGRQQMTKLKLFAGAEHPHQAQQPKVYTLYNNEIKSSEHKNNLKEAVK